VLGNTCVLSNVKLGDVLVRCKVGVIDCTEANLHFRLGFPSDDIRCLEVTLVPKAEPSITTTLGEVSIYDIVSGGWVGGVAG
jgi:hypothetical protein